MSALPKYDHYKASDVEWLGDVPSHWEVRSLRGILKERGETNEGTKTDFILSVMKDRGVIPYTEKGNVGNKMSEDITTYKLVCPGDLVINKMNAIIGSLGISEYHGALSKVYFVMQPRYEYLNNRFYGYLFQIRDFQKSLCKISYGIMELRESINFNEFKNLPLPLPPKPEQDRIVAFLDQKTAEIDALIAKKQRQIELLDEQKAILINRAVTRGLNPNAKLKPSGIEWIGDIPEHWEASQIKHLGNIVSGYAFPSTEFTENTADCRVVKIANIQTMRMDWADASYISNRYLKQLPQFRVGKGDLLFALTRPIIKAGIKAAIVEAEWPMLLNQRNAVFHPSRKINLEWLYYIIVNPEFVAHFDTLIDKTGQQPNISPVDIGNIVVPLPPKEERLRICQYLTDAQIRFSEVVQKIEAHIESLKILRSTLIAHAVTGRIKV